MIKPYHWVLFDADETLFHFDAFRGLKQMFNTYGIDFTENDFEEYQNINKPLWVHYQNGHLTAKQVQCDRFNHWAKKLNIEPAVLNSGFLKAMADICEPIDGAVNLLNALKGNAKLGIITNGFVELQQVRLEATGLDHYFDVLVISEEVGVAKPHPAIFEHAWALMGNPPREHVLMVGDNPDSDILGGINAGFDTCWLNTHRRTAPAGIKPKYEVSSLEDLERLLRAFHLE
jgi:YjjG family noncanonical pyrimidine nucleotidase